VINLKETQLAIVQMKTARILKKSKKRKREVKYYMGICLKRKENKRSKKKKERKDKIKSQNI
jgi:hypothetical protein